MIRLRGNKFRTTRTDEEAEWTFLRVCVLHGAPEEGRKHAVTIACSPKQCHTDKRHDTFTVALRHRDFILNMTTAALQADTAQVMVPADSCFAAVTAIDDHKTGEIQGQRLDSSSRLINLWEIRVHVTNASSRETTVRVTGGMKVKTDKHESSPRAAMSAVPDVRARCKETGITALHIRLRITGGTKTRTPGLGAQNALRALARVSMKIGRIEDATPNPTDCTRRVTVAVVAVCEDG